MLDELRKKSPYLKESYAFWGAFGITTIVAAGWAVSLPIRISNLDVSLNIEGAEQTAGGVSEFLDQLKGEAGAVLKATTTPSTLPATDPSSWGIGSTTGQGTTTTDPILIATSSAPAATSSNDI